MRTRGGKGPCPVPNKYRKSGGEGGDSRAARRGSLHISPGAKQTSPWSLVTTPFLMSAQRIRPT